MAELPNIYTNLHKNLNFMPTYKWRRPNSCSPPTTAWLWAINHAVLSTVRRMVQKTMA